MVKAKSRNKKAYKNKNILRIMIVVVLILLIPLLMMQISSEWNWDAPDFVIIGILLFGMGSMFVLIARKIRSNSNRILVGIAFTVALLYLWAELAVGIFTNWGS